MDTATYSYDNDHIEQIDHIAFDILSNREILEMSALGNTAGITVPDLYDNNEPKKGGLIDARLGPSDNNSVCATCGLKSNLCVGHFGHIELSEYVYHPGYLPIVHKILTCVCTRCSKLLLYKNEEEIKKILRTKSQKERLAYIRASVKNVTHCQKSNYGCGTPVPKINIDKKKGSGAINIIGEYDLEGSKDDDGNEGRKKNRLIFTPDIVHDILSRISDEDCRILGMDPDRSRPEDMIHKIFPVPPNQVRPSVRGEFMGGSTMEDDLTHKLADIVKANMRIIKNKENQTEANTKYNTEHAHLLQFHVASYTSSDSTMMPKTEQKGKPFKSLESRIKSKEGRIRNNLMGKRGDFTARTVIEMWLQYM